MSTTTEAPNSGLDYVKYAAAVALLLGGLVFYFMQPNQAGWIRGLAVAAGIIAGAAVFFTSSAGARLMRFGREAYAELRRISWPERRETIQMTVVVFGFVIVMALILFLLDKTLEWVLYDLILRWRK